MIVLDTHIWFWWVPDPARLAERQKEYIASNQDAGIGVSVISCWEIAMLVQRGRLTLPDPVDAWVDQALGYSGVRALPLTAEIAVESVQLRDWEHRDPADRFIVATARAYDAVLVTNDSVILAYPHVNRL